MLARWHPIAFLLASALLFAAGAAGAKLEACGDIFLFTTENCEFVADHQCHQRCEPIAMEQACAAELHGACEAGCAARATTECQESCQTACLAECDAASRATQPATCMSLALADCQPACHEQCGSIEHIGPCRAACGHTCAEACHGICPGVDEGIDEALDCAGTCRVACSGSCRARASIDCQIACQTSSFEACATRLVRQCKTQCTQAGGAIFCDGQFLNYSDIDACTADLARVTEANESDELHSGETGMDAGVIGPGQDSDIGASDLSTARGCSVATGNARGRMGSFGTLGLAALACWASRRRKCRASVAPTRACPSSYLASIKANRGTDRSSRRGRTLLP